MGKTYEGTLFTNISIIVITNDQSTKTLRMYLSENGEDQNQITKPIVKHRFIPSTILVEPKQSKVITVSIPVIVKRIVNVQGGILNMEISDVSDLKHVVCRIAYNEKPLALNAPTHVDKIARHIASWGRTTEKTVETEIPSKDRDTSSE